MKRVLLFALVAAVAAAAVSAETVMNGLFEAADDVASDIPGVLTANGDLLVGGVQYDGRVIKLGDLFADLAANRLAGRNGFRPRVVKQYASMQYPASQASWILGGTLYEAGAGYLLIIHLTDAEEGVQLKGWEFALGSQGMEDLLEPSVLDAAGSWDMYEPNDSSSDASAVDLPLVNAPMALGSGDEDWFAIDVPEGNDGMLFLEASTGGVLDTYMELYAPGDLDWARAEDDDSDGSNAVIQYPLSEPGTWYLKVRGYSSDEEGDYTLSISVTERALGPGEPDEGTENASRLGVGASPLSKSIDYANDEDWFRIDLVRPLGPEEVLRVETMGGMDTMITLMDEYEGYIMEDDDSGEDNNAMIMASGLSEGTYYAVVSGYSGESGSYEIMANISIPVRDEYESDDSMTDASRIEVGGRGQRRTFSPMGDQDWVFFDVETQGPYVMATDGNIDTYMELYDEDGVLMDENDDTEESNNARIEKNLSPGRYYLCVTPYSSAGPEDVYTLTVVSSR